MNWLAEIMLEHYIETNLSLPDTWCPKYVFEEIVYARWAAYELLSRIRKSDKPANTIIRDFIGEMQECYALDTASTTAKTFYIAKGAAEQILADI